MGYLEVLRAGSLKRSLAGHRQRVPTHGEHGTAGLDIPNASKGNAG